MLAADEEQMGEDSQNRSQYDVKYLEMNDISKSMRQRIKEMMPKIWGIKFNVGE